MTPTVFIDTNVVIDLLAKREPFWHSSASIFDLAEREKITAFISPLTLVTVYYVLRNYYKLPHSGIIQQFDVLCSYISLASTSEQHILAAIQSAFTDFEDAVLYESAKGIPALSDIVTRNPKHFLVSEIAIATPDEFLTKYSF
ncbi:type II toxin-antitoxin system VapC family toxin [Larkinella sp. VNQ87]|uniref:type II toxin-antitoxin system VapC family toxin n=1 Tax=Larkinella sp. VNQ87 TaxID=3400921 RepID=UPI003BFAF381